MSEPTKKLRILIAEDHQMVREGIKLLVNGQRDMEVVGEADDGEGVFAMISELMPDLVILDISMPGMNGLTTTKKIREKYSDLLLLTLTRHSDDGRLRQLLAAGTNGYVLKQSAPTELLNAIRSIAAGNSFIDPSLTRKVLGSFVGRADSMNETKIGELTPREEELVKLIALGYSNKEIAGRLNLSVKTVEAHKSNAMRKLGVTSRVDIVRYAIMRGWMKDS